MKQLKLSLYFYLLLHASLTLAQTCNSAIVASAPDSRYTASANGTVLDKKTGLTWMRCALGQSWDGTACTGTVQGYTWQSALQTAESHVFAGLSDWRLPNNKELHSIVEQRCYTPAINLTAFPNATGDWFWSSSPYAGYGGYAWIVYFYFGGGDFAFKDIGYAVRLVRGGQ